jgi:iron(III) transport system substrate-binding protein
MSIAATPWHCLAVALLLGLAPAPGRATDSEQSLYEAARKEGSVVVWTPLEIGFYGKIAARFSARYPGIQIEPFRIQPGPAIERTVTEAKAGRVNVDVIDPNIAYVPILLQHGLLEPYAWDQVFGIAADRMLFDKRALVLGHYDLPLGYNSNLVGAGALSSWQDVLDPQWRGKVLLEARGFPLAILAAKWGEPTTQAYVEKLMANAPIIVKGATAAAEGLAGGQGSIAIGAYAARLTLYKGAGAPVDWARVGPIPAQQVAVAPIKGAPHPNAARLLAAYWTTAEAQDLFYEEQRYGMVGYYLSPRGEELKRRGIEVVLETTDIEQDMRRLRMVGRAIGGIK